MAQDKATNIMLLLCCDKGVVDKTILFCPLVFFNDDAFEVEDYPCASMVVSNKSFLHDQAMNKPTTLAENMCPAAPKDSAANSSHGLPATASLHVDGEYPSSMEMDNLYPLEGVLPRVLHSLTLGLGQPWNHVSAR